MKGSFKYSDYATFSLLIRESEISFILEALVEAAEEKLFDWSICEDEITSMQSILAASAAGSLPIRSVQQGTIPTDKSESELLDWLVHGESFFSKKYVILGFRHHGDSRKVHFEISKEEYMPFYDACKTIFDNYKKNDRYNEQIGYLDSCELVDRGTYLCGFSFRSKLFIVDDHILREFEVKASYDEVVGYWASNWHGKGERG